MPHAGNTRPSRSEAVKVEVLDRVIGETKDVTMRLRLALLLWIGVGFGVTRPAPTVTTSTLVKTYFLSPYGNDANPGTIAAPWQTMEAAAIRVQAGDTVFLRGGTYLNPASAWTTSGTQGKPITISGYADEKAVLDGQGVYPTHDGSYMIAILGDWYLVENLEIANSGQSGVLSRGTHVTLRNLEIHHSHQAAITLTGDYDVAEYVHAWMNGLVNVNNQSGVTGGWPAAITCARYPQHCTLRHNLVHDTWGEGISTFEATYTTIEDNISFNNQTNYYLSDTKFSIVQRNLGYCTPGNPIDPYFTQVGLLIGDEKGVLINGSRYPSSDNTIINNFLLGCNYNLAAGTQESTNSLYAHNTLVNSRGDPGERANIMISAAGSCTNCRFINNLILEEDPISIAKGGNLSWGFSHNLWSMAPDVSFMGTRDIIADPLLAMTGETRPGQLTAEYFKLIADSPAIDQAVPLPEVINDHFLAIRGTNPDIGGHEYGGVTPSPTLP